MAVVRSRSGGTRGLLVAAFLLAACTAGAPGAQGPRGEAGRAGEPGRPGPSGESVAVTAVAAGDEACPAGGARFTSPSGVAYACNGRDAASDPLPAYAPGQVVLPAGFTPMSRPLRPGERFVWSAMPAPLRPGPQVVTAYPFEWRSQDQVVASMVRRRRATLDPVTRAFLWGPEEAITVEPASYFAPGVYPTGGRQFRDGSFLHDRATGLTYFAISGITGTSDGWRSLDVPLFVSSDGLAWRRAGQATFAAAYQPYPHTWTPEWFVDSDGQVYLLIAGNHDLAYARYWLLRCKDPGTFQVWEDVGMLQGSAFPTIRSTGLPSMIDGVLFQRDGVYYVIWKAEMSLPGSEPHGQLGIAWSTSLLGPYDAGHRLVDPDGTGLNGEGMSVLELPPGGPYRFRLLWDNYQRVSYRGVASQHVYADTNDFVTFSPVRPTGFGETYDRNTTFVMGGP